MSKLPSFQVEGYDFYKPHAPVELVDWPPSLTRQEFAEDCDINVIMQRFEKTGQLPSNGREPMYVDLTALPPDFQTAMDMLNAAETAFMTLPAVVRKQFDNDPQEFVAFASDPGNLDQMRVWGLAAPQEELVAPILEPPAPKVEAPVEPPRAAPAA